VTERKPCPFQVGQTVEYQPSDRGRGLVLMTDEAKLVRGKRYRIAAVRGAEFVLVEGFERTPGGGLHWTEFAPIPSPA
jgi:hypothetical protein